MISIDEFVNVDCSQGRVNTQQVFGLSNSDLVPGKYEGGWHFVLCISVYCSFVLVLLVTKEVATLVNFGLKNV